MGKGDGRRRFTYFILHTPCLCAHLQVYHCLQSLTIGVPQQQPGLRTLRCHGQTTGVDSILVCVTGHVTETGSKVSIRVTGCDEQVQGYYGMLNGHGRVSGSIRLGQEVSLGGRIGG